MARETFIKHDIRRAVAAAQTAAAMPHVWDIGESGRSPDADLPDDTIFVLDDNYELDDPTCVYLDGVDEVALFYRVLHGMYMSRDKSQRTLEIMKLNIVLPHVA